MRRAPNYTNATLLSLLVNLLWLFSLVWVVAGFGAVLLLAVVLNLAISRLERRLRDNDGYSRG
ncbi:hypothetical protein [Poseidonocella sedimentorum]|uniref:Histidinol phosphate aminotransferase n=1 Tax=Poseidonocella sedimentorum TaxID=871652 RepID=A0A1I6EB65_9RHOB|nr:hypothetical protein [Poseidonocella sedimentorum]SFR14821.1 hypothetical protein SAMN04515673_10939 [Poseidonocella sedimentorum]